jgi:kynurenine formamidase
MDVFTPDMPGGFRPDGFDWPVHQVLLGQDTLIIENLGPGLAKVAGHRVEIVAVPSRIHDSDAGPVVPLARAID